MSARIIDICDAIVSVMDSYLDWSIPISPERAYAPKWKPSELASVQVVIAPTTRDRAYQARGADRLTYSIDVGVFKHIQGDQDARDAEVDALIALVDEIEDFWMRRFLTVESKRVTTVNASTDPVYDAELLRDAGVFGSVLTITMTEVLS